MELNVKYVRFELENCQHVTVRGFLICQELFFKRLKENDSENYYSNIKECIL